MMRPRHDETGGRRSTGRWFGKTAGARSAKRGAGAVAVVLAMLWLASAALAAFTQTASTHLTAGRAGQSTGVSADVRASDPAAPGAKPRSVTSLVITFPAGTRFDLRTSMVKRCHLTDRQLTTPFGPSCPRASRIGQGSAVANVAPFTPTTVKERVVAYVRSATRAILVVTPDLPGTPIEIMPITATGAKLTIGVPRLIWGKLIHVVLVSLKLDLPALGKGRSALVTAGRCTARRWTVQNHFVYSDHGTMDVASSSSCR